MWPQKRRCTLEGPGSRASRMSQQLLGEGEPRLQQVFRTLEADRIPHFTTFVSSFKHLFSPQSPTVPRNYQAAPEGLARVSTAQLAVKGKE